jgi:hypothetical protein
MKRDFLPSSFCIDPIKGLDRRGGEKGVIGEERGVIGESTFMWVVEFRSVKGDFREKIDEGRYY